MTRTVDAHDRNRGYSAARVLATGYFAMLLARVVAFFDLNGPTVFGAEGVLAAVQHIGSLSRPSGIRRVYSTCLISQNQKANDNTSLAYERTISQSFLGNPDLHSDVVASYA
jgi:hypothetical protein